VDTRSWETIENRDLIPFSRAINIKVEMIMTAHVACPGLTGRDDLPATFSAQVIDQILRKELGFSGVVITDALEMSAADGYMKTGAGPEVIVEPVKEHRGILVLRGEGLRGEIQDTDPGREGVPPLEAKALIPEAKETAERVQNILSRVGKILADEPKANMVLLRGFAKHTRYPSMKERYGLNSLAIAAYPMYRGISRLVGMTVLSNVSNLEEEFKALEENFSKYDFFFLHVKQTDSRGEDGNFDAKVAVIEEVDRFIPRVRALKPDVLVVTGDHSTPAKLASHSWHPLPVILHSKFCLIDGVRRFDEVSCIQGALGRMPSVDLMPLALANALRLNKFGA